MVSKHTLKIASVINRVQTRSYKKALAEKESVETNTSLILAAIVKVQRKNKLGHKYSLRKTLNKKYSKNDSIKKKIKSTTNKKSIKKKTELNNTSQKKRRFSQDNKSSMKKRRTK